MLHLFLDLDKGKALMIRVLNRLFLSLFFRSGYALRISKLEKDLNLIFILLEKKDIINKYKAFINLLQIQKPVNLELKNLGPENDGSYVLANEFNANQNVISLGVGKNIDLEVYLANLGLKVVLCDGTISKLPRQHKNFQFINKNVYGDFPRSNSQAVSINELFSRLQKKSGYSTENILLVDIEGSEYDVLENIKPEYLLSCRQLTVEFHGIFEKLKSGDSELLEVTKKLLDFFVPVSAHGNNFGAFISENNQNYADVIETTWLRRDLDVFRKGENRFNTELCRPNNPKSNDLNLNW